MLDNYFNEWIKNYIKELIINQNETDTEECKNIYSINEYCNILYPALQIISANSDASIDELRYLLYKNSGIEEKVSDFINKSALAAGCNLSYGTKIFHETIVAGNQSEVKYVDGKFEDDVVKMSDDSIFDLASTTKLFTSLSTLKLISLGKLSLDTKVSDICPEFTGLYDITILDLMTLNYPFQTKGRVDDAKDAKEAEEVLHTMFVGTQKRYTDMGAMVLKYVIEKVSGMPLYEFIKENILVPANMTNTYASVPEDKIPYLAKTAYEVKYLENGPVRSIFDDGMVHDPKARLLSSLGLAGHAGLFTSSKDMSNLACSLISKEIIPADLMVELAKNRTGERYINENGTATSTQYYGLLCYSKNPNVDDSEVHPALSGTAFASAGFTGTQFTVDQLNGIYSFLGSNRTHSRVTSVYSAYRSFVYQEDG